MPTHYEGEASEVRALDAYVKLMRAAHSVSGRLSVHLRELGLTESQLGVLEMIHHLGPLRQQHICDKLLLSRANVTLLVDQLTERRLLRRERDPHDRRAVRVHLTATGKRRIERVFPRHVRRLVEIFSALTQEEQLALARLCRALGLAQREHGS